MYGKREKKLASMSLLQLSIIMRSLDILVSRGSLFITNLLKALLLCTLSIFVLVRHHRVASFNFPCCGQLTPLFNDNKGLLPNLPLNWKSPRCVYRLFSLKQSTLGLQVFVFLAPPTIETLIFILFPFFSGPFVLAGLLAQKYFQPRVHKHFFPSSHCGNCFIFKTGGEAKQLKPLSRTVGQPVC